MKVKLFGNRKESLLSQPDKLADDYAQQVLGVLGPKPKFGISSYLSLDLILLGLGPDGHTCSLFPGHPLLEEKVKIVASITDSPKPPPIRITLTLPVVNAGNF